MFFRHSAQVLSLSIVMIAAAPNAHAGWFSNAWDNAKHSVTHVVDKKVKDIKKDADAVANFTTTGARTICKTALKGILFKVIDGAKGTCKAQAAEAGTECNAEVDVETDGLGGVACDAAAVLYKAECEAGGFVAKVASSEITNKSCDKI